MLEKLLIIHYLTELLVLSGLVCNLLLIRSNSNFRRNVVIVLESAFDIVVLLGLILYTQSLLEAFLIPVPTQHYKTVWQTVKRMLHD